MSPVHGEMADRRSFLRSFVRSFVPLPAAGLVFPAESSVGEITGSKTRTDDPSPISLVTIENGSRNSLSLLSRSLSLSLSLWESRVPCRVLIDGSIDEHACDNDGDVVAWKLLMEDLIKGLDRVRWLETKGTEEVKGNDLSWFDSNSKWSWIIKRCRRKWDYCIIV